MKRFATGARGLALLGTVLVTGWVLWLVLVTAYGRIGYPFDLEWMEGGMLLHALRVSQGLPLYVEPSPDFIPYIYPPLYSWVVGALGHLFGVSYSLGRAVSLVGSMAAAGLLIWAIRREGYTWLAALAASAVFLSTYDDCGAFFDLVRIDGLAVGLLAAALVISRGASPAALRAGGVLLALAFATKHNHAIFGFPIALVLWKEHGWRRAATFAAWAAVPALVFTIILTITSRGLFLTYLLAVPATHPLVADRAWPQSEQELFLTFPWFLGLGLLVGLVHIRRWSFRGRYWVSTIGTGVFASILMRAHHGGFLNVLIPGFWLLALAGGLGLGALLKRWPHPALWLLGAAVTGWEVHQGSWEPGRYTPSAADRRAGEEILNEIAAIDGRVLMPHSPYYPVLVGKQPCFHLISFWDVTHGHTPFPKAEQAFRQSIASHEYAAVIVTNRKFGYGLDKHYQVEETIKLPPRVFMPKTGWRARPRYIYVPSKPDDTAQPGDNNENTP